MFEVQLADTLLSCSVTGSVLQNMRNICEDFAEAMDMTYNCKIMYSDKNSVTFYPYKTFMKRIDKLFDTAAHKIFKTFDDIRKYVGLRNIIEIIDEHQSKFRRKDKWLYCNSNSDSIRLYN